MHHCNGRELSEFANCRFCRKFTELTEKYRDLLDKSNNLVVHKEVTSGYESEIKRLDVTNSELMAQLEIEKEKLHTLEAAFENMRKQGENELNNANVLFEVTLSIRPSGCKRILPSFFRTWNHSLQVQSLIIWKRN